LLADVVGWLVLIVWVIWVIGMTLGIVLTFVAQWGANRLFGDSSLNPASPH
jgi:hypothetical protein